MFGRDFASHVRKQQKENPHYDKISAILAYNGLLIPDLVGQVLDTDVTIRTFPEAYTKLLEEYSETLPDIDWTYLPNDAAEADMYIKEKLQMYSYAYQERQRTAAMNYFFTRKYDCGEDYDKIITLMRKMEARYSDSIAYDWHPIEDDIFVYIEELFVDVYEFYLEVRSEPVAQS
jgi:hypothetical protein